MEKAERETVIVINDADRAEGFFTLFTTSRAILDKVTKKVGKGNFVSESIALLDKRFCVAKLKIPVRCLRVAHSIVKPPRTGGHMTPKSHFNNKPKGEK